MFFIPPMGTRIPAAELGPAVGPMPALMLPFAPVTTRIATAGSFVGRAAERDFPTRDPSLTGTARPAAGPAPSFDFLRGLGNVAGNLIANVVRVAVLTASGPAAPVVAPFFNAAIRALIPPPVPPTARITTPILQPESTATPIERDRPEYELQASRGSVVEVTEEGHATLEVETVQGTKTVEFDLPFPEVGL